MTILQIRAVLLTAELGSISAAAKELNVSQPNASNSVRLLEEEIGFPVFHRSSSGVELTPKGEQFLNHARQILDQNKKILDLRSVEETYRLRLGCKYYYPAVKAFLTLSEQHREDRTADFRYYSVSVEEGIEQLTGRELDIVIAPVLKHQVSGLMRKCKHFDIHLTSLCEIPAVITVRKDHPAALDGRCLHITQGCDAMKDFPYIAYRNLSADTSSTAYNDSDYIQCSYKMFTDEMEMKLQMISVTNAFSFGIATTNPLMEQFGLASFPLPGVSLEAFALTRPADVHSREIKEYLDLLNSELQTVKK